MICCLNARLCIQIYWSHGFLMAFQINAHSVWIHKGYYISIQQMVPAWPPGIFFLFGSNDVHVPIAKRKYPNFQVHASFSFFRFRAIWKVGGRVIFFHQIFWKLQTLKACKFQNMIDRGITAFLGDISYYLDKMCEKSFVHFSLIHTLPWEIAKNDYDLYPNLTLLKAHFFKISN